MAVFWVCVIVLAGSFYTAFCHGEWLTQVIRRKTGTTFHPSSLAVGITCATFGTLVALGTTGSSVALLYQQSSFVSAKITAIGLAPEQIRTDEWVVFTPMAIGQKTHQPSFPIVNHNLGEDGQNMLVVGMTGVPVKHITQFAKPATWGFYFLDLRRALAWYWWFPVFGCLLALFWLFTLLLPGRWRLGFSLSLLFCLSPYCVAWSNWPDYAVFFPTVALCTAMTLLFRNNSRSQLIGWSIVLGLSIAGFVLVLYPPWQVTLGYLYLLLAAGLIARDRAILRISSDRIIAFVSATIIAGTILLAWWLDARQAIHVMMNTVYPGSRDVTGGSMTMSYLLRGYTNISSLYTLDGYLNQSEIASFYYLLLPLASAIGLRLKSLRKCYHVPLAISSYVAYAAIFAFNGVPRLVAHLTLWKVVNDIRTDLAFGLSYVMLCGFVLASGSSNKGNREGQISNIRTDKLLLLSLISLVWVLIAGYFLSQLPKGVFLGMPKGVVAGTLLVVFVSGIWLMSPNSRKFIAISLATCVAASVPFNPLSFAPKTVEIPPDIKSMLSSEKNKGGIGRVLVLQDRVQAQVQAMALVSAGVPTVDGVFFYPQPDLWRQLAVENVPVNVVNRYQHLIFMVGSLKGASPFRIDNPRGDIVEVVLDPQSFNFTLTDAESVLAPEGLTRELLTNPGLRLVLSGNGWSWFRVLKAAPKSSPPIGNVDIMPHSTVTRASRLLFEGWALSKDGISKVCLLSDRKVASCTGISKERYDVQEAYPDIFEADKSGWAIGIGSANLSPGSHELVIQAASKTGLTGDLGKVVINIVK